MPLPPPGTFRLYPYAEPPLPAGRYTLSGDVTGLPGPVESMPASVDVVAPRYALPPDQVLSTFPPAGARGSFTSRLPQIVLRRRTLPWERSSDLFGDQTPTPWLALVLLAEGEGELRTDVPVEQCVTDGVSLGPDRDVPKGACIEVPQRVVRAVFPTREDLSVLAHVREVDLADTELGMGDDDGWMAVVLANRLPQADTRYLACLINLEEQYPRLPTVSDTELVLDFDPSITVVDVRALNLAALGTAPTYDRAVMGLSGTQVPAVGGLAAVAGAGGELRPAGGADAELRLADGAATVSTAGVTGVRAVSGAAVPSGAGWAATAGRAAMDASLVPGAAAEHVAGALAGKLALADGFSFPVAVLAEPVLRFPVLAYWSFTCEARGDFQYLAERVSSRLLGHLPQPGVSDTPDGDPASPGPPPPALPAETPAARPLPLVAETGHVALDATTRRGDATQAWFRGPLAPTPVERAPVRADGSGRPPLAHHADQLRRVVPDGREDLGYAAAFEVGRLLALSQPGVAAALGRWRQDAFGAARARGAAADAVAGSPTDFARLVARADPLGDDTSEFLRAGGAGRRTVRALLETLGATPEVFAPPRPLADPGAAAAVLARLAEEGRDPAVAIGLGLSDALGEVDAAEAPAVAAVLAGVPALVAGVRDFTADVAVLRLALEAEAGRLAEAAGALSGQEGFTLGEREGNR